MDAAGDVVLLTLLAAAASALVYVLTRSNCSGDGTFNPLDAGMAGRNAYCRALTLPPHPSSVSSVALAGVVFALPSLVALVGGTIAWRAQRRRVLRRFALAACTLEAASFGLVFAAGVHAVPGP